MASGEHSRARGALPAAGGEVSRRDLLASAVAPPTAITLPPLRDGCPSPEMGEGSHAEWEAALAGLRAAEAEIAAFKRVEPGGASFQQQWALDEAFSDLACAQNAALERLLLVPAPDLAALATKLALAVEEMAWELAEGEASMAMLAADAARLAGA